MTSDADRAANLLLSTHELVSLPLQIAAALFLLYTQVRLAFVAGLALTVVLMPVNRVLVAAMARATAKMLHHRDARLDVIAVMLEHLRAIAMLGWQRVMIGQVRLVFHTLHGEPCSNARCAFEGVRAPMSLRACGRGPWPTHGVARALQVTQHRERELRQLAVKMYLDAGCVCSWALPSCLFAASTFGLAALWHVPLTPATVLVSLALFSTLVLPLNALPWAAGGFVEAMVSAHRLAVFLDQVDDDKDAHTPDKDTRPAAAETASAAGHGRPPKPANGATDGVRPHVPAGAHSFGWDVTPWRGAESSPAQASSRVAAAERGMPVPIVQFMSATFSHMPAPRAHREASDGGRATEHASATLRDISVAIPKVCSIAVATCKMHCCSESDYVAGTAVPQ